MPRLKLLLNIHISSLYACSEKTFTGWICLMQQFRQISNLAFLNWEMSVVKNLQL